MPVSIQAFTPMHLVSLELDKHYLGFRLQRQYSKDLHLPQESQIQQIKKKKLRLTLVHSMKLKSVEGCKKT